MTHQKSFRRHMGLLYSSYHRALFGGVSPIVRTNAGWVEHESLSTLDQRDPDLRRQSISSFGSSLELECVTTTTTT